MKFIETLIEHFGYGAIFDRNKVFFRYGLYDYRIYKVLKQGLQFSGIDTKYPNGTELSASDNGNIAIAGVFIKRSLRGIRINFQGRDSRDD